MVPEMLEAPLRWRKPERVFVNSMSDLFHEDVPDEFIDQVFAVMALCPQHTFQVLTKRPERMRAYMTAPVTGSWAGRVEPDEGAHWRVRAAMTEMLSTCPARALNDAVAWQESHFPEGDGFMRRWPLPNVWLGVSVEDQATADERIPLLLETPAAVRWVSFEPALGLVDFTSIKHTAGPGYFGDCLQWYHKPDAAGDQPFGALDWVVVGGESGRGARPFDVEWARSTVRQCKAAGVPVFVKQIGAKPFERQPSLDKGFAGRDLLDVMNRPRPPQMNGWGRITTATETFYQRHLDLNDRKGGDMEEWPADLRVREWPEVRS